MELRERVAFDPKQVPHALQAARQGDADAGVVILSTCNRTEIYMDSRFQPEQVLAWLAGWHKLEPSSLHDVHYIYNEEHVAQHLMKVASGLDSLVLGEPQILGQLKSAYAVAEEAGTLNAPLHQLFQMAFATAKRVRTETAIGQNPVSVAYAAVRLAQQVFAELKNKTVLLIGAGETIQLVSQHLHEQGVRDFIIANRTLVSAQALGERLNAEAILLSDIPEHLDRVDICVSSTASQLPILGKGAVESALRKRKHKVMFMVDIAVPRDIESEVGELDDVYLFTVDDLSDVIDENRRTREQAAEHAMQIVEEGAAKWRAEQRVTQNADLIRRFRERATEIREAELEKALKSVAAGADAEAVLRRFAGSLTNKLIHQPTTKLSQASSEGREDILAWSVELLGLQDSVQTEGAIDNVRSTPEKADKTKTLSDTAVTSIDQRKSASNKK